MSSYKDELNKILEETQTEIEDINTNLGTIETDIEAINTNLLRDESNAWTTSTGSSSATATLFTNSTGNRIKINFATFSMSFDANNDAYLKYNNSAASDVGSMFRWFALLASAYPETERTYKLENFYMENGEYFRYYVITTGKMYWAIQYREV